MNVLSVHQGHELYGSDRSFILCLGFLKSCFESPTVSVLLPKEGELKEVLDESGYQVSVANLWVPRKSDGFLGLFAKVFTFPWSVFRALGRINKADLLYVNTSVVFDFLVAARFSKTPCIVHVREIPTGISARVIRLLLKFSKATLVFNSTSTRDAFSMPGSVKQHTAPNSVPDRYPEKNERGNRGIGTTFNLLMVGRINSWKGQDLLLEAICLLPAEVRARLNVKILGDVYGQSTLLDNLKAFVAEKLPDVLVEFEGFQAETRPFYLWADAVVVPSKKPEPFGLVAIEAMSAARNVIVADHGGLAEIVEHQKSGLKVTPNDPMSLSQAIETIANENADYGDGARDRYELEYTPDSLKSRMSKVFLEAQAV